MLAIMAIAGKEVDQAAFQQELGEFLGAAAEASGQTLPGDLIQGSGLHPGRDLIQTLAQQGVAFGMSNDRNHAGFLQAGENFGRCF